MKVIGVCVRTESVRQTDIRSFIAKDKNGVGDADMPSALYSGCDVDISAPLYGDCDVNILASLYGGCDVNMSAL